MRPVDGAVRLNPVQQAWMQELGVEAALVRHYAAPLASEIKAHSVVAPAPASARRRAEPARAVQDRMQDLRRTRASIPVQTDPAPAAQPAPRSAKLLYQAYAAQAQASGSAPGWWVVGEAPLTAHTALAQGRAAQLLDAMLAAVHLQPVGVPHPLSDLAAFAARGACILALGRAAAAALLHTTETLEHLRGKVWSCACAPGQAIPVVVTHPPGWLLTHPRDKAGVWRDLLLAQGAARG